MEQKNRTANAKITTIPVTVKSCTEAEPLKSSASIREILSIRAMFAVREHHCRITFPAMYFCSRQRYR